MSGPRIQPGPGRETAQQGHTYQTHDGGAVNVNLPSPWS